MHWGDYGSGLDGVGVWDLVPEGSSWSLSWFSLFFLSRISLNEGRRLRKEGGRNITRRHWGVHRLGDHRSVK
jgi:hypothetical protein